MGRFSYLYTSLLVLAGAGVWLGLGANKLYIGILALVLVGVLTAFWVAARRGALTPANPEKRFRRARGSGRPLVVHFYSDYCLDSLLQRARSYGLEQEYRGKVDFLFIDIGHPEAQDATRAIMGDLGDFVYYGTTGELAGNLGRLDRKMLERITEPRTEAAKHRGG